jgi:Uma2 family endonuclease
VHAAGAFVALKAKPLARLRRVTLHSDLHPVREESMATAALNRYTPEEYLALERHAEFKSEYIDGRIIAMSGGSIPHNYIAGNIYAGLLARFSGRPCHIFFADVKVRSGRGTNYTYPDVMALCGARGMATSTRKSSRIPR